MPTPPMFRKPNEYGNTAGALDALIGEYLRAKESQKQMGVQSSMQKLQLAQQGVDPSGVNLEDPNSIAKITAEFVAQKKARSAQEADMMAQKEAESYAARRKDMAQANLATAQAEMARGGHGGSAIPGMVDIGGGLLRNEATGMTGRIKPGHKGNEWVPLPGQAIGANGKVVFTTSQEQESKPTGAEFAARGFADKASQANANLESLEKSGFDPAGLAAGVGSFTPNLMKGDAVQRLEQSKRQFVNAILRRESGAAIPESELKNYTRQYFPEMGDSPSVMAQKAQARKIAISGLEAEGSRVPSSLPASQTTQAPPPPAGDIASQARKLLEMRRQNARPR